MRRIWMVLIGTMAIATGCATSNQAAPTASSTSSAVAETSNHAAISSEKYDEIQSTFRRKTTAVADCYTDEMERTGNKKVEGDVRLTMIISTNGKASDVKVEQTTLHSPPIEECVCERVKTWDFPEIPKSTTFTWTFSFKPAW